MNSTAKCEYLTAQEVVLLIKAAACVGRYGTRDASLILMASRHRLASAEIVNLLWQHIDLDTLPNALLILMIYCHALRVSEVMKLRWCDVDLDQLSIKISRSKNKVSSVHALNRQEADWLLRLRRDGVASDYIFCSDTGNPLSRRTIDFIVARAAQIAGFQQCVYPNAIRQARAFHLAKAGMAVGILGRILGHHSRKVKTTLGNYRQAHLHVLPNKR
jgi:integrase